MKSFTFFGTDAPWPAAGRSSRALLGLFLLVLSLCGIVHGVRAGMAHALYFQARYGGRESHPDAIFVLCEQADRLYPFNYNLCILAAKTAYAASFSGDRNESARLLALAERWCDKGLRIDVYKRSLRLLKTRLMAMKSLPDAIRYWEAYVEWEFWAPRNHAVLVELYSRAGDFDRALESLAWTRGSDCYADASRKFTEAWDREKTFKAASGTRP